MHGGDIYRHKVDIDFSTNINPLGVPQEIRLALSDAVNHVSAYPDYTYEKLYESISIRTGFGTEHIAVGNGASELLSWIFNILKPYRLLIANPCFSGYERAAEAAGIDEIKYYELREENNFCIDKRFVESITDDIDVICIANPNNPTGRLVDEDLMEQIVRKAEEIGAYLIVDECFRGFTDAKSAMQYKYDRLVVIDAYTKLYAIPGVRLGYMLCRDETFTAKLKACMPEWNISVFADAAASAVNAVDDEYIRKAIGMLDAERRYLMCELKKRGIKAYPSDANFILIYTELELFDKLLERGILIRDCIDYIGLRKGYYRIAVKKHEDNDKLINVIKMITTEITQS